MLKTCQSSETLNILNMIQETPKTILDPPRHFSDQQKCRKYFRQKLLLTTSNDPLDASQMLPNNFKKCSKHVKSLAKALGQSRVLDH